MVDSEMALPQERLQGFAGHFEQAVQALRGALTDLLASVGADPGTPQAVARRFGLNKNLAWKISKIVHSSDLYASVQHLPGASGLDILLRAFHRAGAPASAIRAVRDAVGEYERMVEIHAGDRASLELMLSSMVPERGSTDLLESSRKLSYQGNSATWGVQTRVRLGMQVVAANADNPELLDIAAIGGLFDYRRLRPSASWPLVMAQSFNDDETPLPLKQEPLDPRCGPDEPPLLHDFCTQPLPETRLVQLPRGALFELSEGPIGNTAALDCVFGWLRRAFAPMWRDEQNQIGEHLVTITTPSEMVSFELLAHADLPLPPPEIALFSLMEYGLEGAASVRRRYQLPTVEPLQDLGARPPVVAHPSLARIPELATYACQRLGWKLEDFQGWRVTIKHPPIPSVLTLRYALPEKPA